MRGGKQRRDFEPDMLAKLGPHLRAAVQARMDGLTQAEGAARCGCTVAAFKSALHRVRRMFGLCDGRTGRIPRRGQITFAYFSAEDIEELPKRTAAAVKLAVAGCTLAEMSDRLKVPYDTVENRLRYARFLLAQRGSRGAPVGDGGRCRCGLLLPCHDCTGRAETYMRSGQEAA